MLACAIVKIFVKCLIDRGIAKDWQWCLPYIWNMIYTLTFQDFETIQSIIIFFFLEISSICTCIRLLFFYIIYTCIFKCSVISIVFCLTMNLQYVLLQYILILMIPLSWFVMIEHLPYLYLFCLEEIKTKTMFWNFLFFVLCRITIKYKRRG